MAMPLRLQRYDNFGNYANNWGILCEKMGDGRWAMGRRSAYWILDASLLDIGRPAGYWRLGMGDGIWDMGYGRWAIGRPIAS